MSTGPHNRVGFARGQRAEAAISRAYLTIQKQAPFERITAEHIRRLLPAEHRNLSCAQINRHLGHLRAKAAVAAALADTRATITCTTPPPGGKNNTMSASINCDDVEEPADGRGPR